MKISNLALAIAIVVMLAIAAFAFDHSPPTATREKPVAVKTTPATSINQAQIVMPLRYDTAVSMPVEQIALAGEKSNAEAVARRALVTSDTYVDEWIADVPTPPNERAFLGFAIRPREQV
jgi:hypothetical protein